MDVSFLTLNLLLESVSLDNPIEHLYVAEIEFNANKATKRQIVYHEIFPTILQKNLILDPSERSCFQLLELYDETHEKTLKLIPQQKRHILFYFLLYNHFILRI